MGSEEHRSSAIVPNRFDSCRWVVSPNNGREWRLLPHRVSGAIGGNTCKCHSFMCLTRQGKPRYRHAFCISSIVLEARAMPTGGQEGDPPHMLGRAISRGRTDDPESSFPRPAPRGCATRLPQGGSSMAEASILGCGCKESPPAFSTAAIYEWGGSRRGMRLGE